MRDVEYDTEGEYEYECLQCGDVIVAVSHPGECSDCGGTLRNRGMPYE